MPRKRKTVDARPNPDNLVRAYMRVYILLTHTRDWQVTQAKIQELWARSKNVGKRQKKSADAAHTRTRAQADREWQQARDQLEALADRENAQRQEIKMLLEKATIELDDLEGRHIVEGEFACQLTL